MYLQSADSYLIIVLVVLLYLSLQLLVILTLQSRHPYL